MRYAIFLLLAFASVARAQAFGPNQLTRAEVSEGWILLFDGESTYGWTVEEGNVRVENKRFVVGGKSSAKVSWNSVCPITYEFGCEFRGSSAFTLLFGEAKWRRALDNPIAENAGLEDGWLGLSETAKILGNQRDFSLTPTKNLNFAHGRAEGAKDAVPGRYAISTDENFHAEFRSMKLRPTVTSSLFNAKDLTGWKIFPGKKSKFDVQDGLLTIENGPGDLQTEGTYKNFLLQLECKTNGKHLNSGVFFRCRAGEYQNGYEAQINNNYLPDATKEYVVEEFDSKTNKLLEKKTVKSSAADYGTGAIYRRVPARKEVAKDGEWFTLTVLAHGNHFATWVNGIQTVDWYDNRPPSDNARTGYRKEGGHISLQGHDPTTNLSFRNIRIATLPD